MPPIKSVIKVEIQQYFLPHKWFVSTKNFNPEVYFFVNSGNQKLCMVFACPNGVKTIISHYTLWLVSFSF